MNAEKIIAYMVSKGYRISEAPGTLNIVYVEGVNEYGLPNADRMDEWNDRRLLIERFQNGWQCIHNVAATTEPGRSATFSKSAAARGGVARIAFGQYRDAWRIGLHKSNKKHPALVQVRPVSVHRDANRDGIRNHDKIQTGLFGINQHGTLGVKSTRVGNWSEGCLVGWDWTSHLQFMNLLNDDVRVQQNRNFEWDTTIINGDELYAFEVPSIAAL